MARRNDIDWEAVERDYRLGILTIKEICDKHTVSSSRLRTKAKEMNWTRDLSKEVRATAKAKVMQHTKAEAEKKFMEEVKKSAEAGAAESAAKTFSAIDAAAELQATIEIRQQGRLARNHRILEALQEKVEDQIASFPDIRKAVQELLSGGNPLAAAEVIKLLNVPLLADTAKKLQDMNTRLQSDERVAHGMTEKGGDGGGDSISQAIKQLDGES